MTSTMGPARIAQWALGALVIVLGLMGLSRGYEGEGGMHHGGAASPTSTAAPAGMTVSGAEILAGDPTTAAVRLVIVNNTGADDVLLGVSSGAGSSTDVDGEPIPIAAGDTLTFGTGTGEEQARAMTVRDLYGPLQPGQTVSLSLDFERAPSVLVDARVIDP